MNLRIGEVKIDFADEQRPEAAPSREHTVQLKWIGKSSFIYSMSKNYANKAVAARRVSNCVCMSMKTNINRLIKFPLEHSEVESEREN